MSVFPPGLPVFFLLLFLPYLSTAQQVVAAAGDDFSGGGFSMSWTLGEPIIETFEDGNSILTQGFHQPGLMITGVDGVGDGPAIKAFPNPAGDQISISLPLELSGRLWVELYDFQGRHLKTAELRDGEMAMPLVGLPGGAYLLVVRRPDAVLKSFKILKK